MLIIDQPDELVQRVLVRGDWKGPNCLKAGNVGKDGLVTGRMTKKAYLCLLELTFPGVDDDPWSDKRWKSVLRC